MTREHVRAALLQALRRVAPESDPSSVRADGDLRDQLDIDSMDFLTFISALHELLGVEIAERDYPRLYTLAGALEYLSERTVSES